MGMLSSMSRDDDEWAGVGIPAWHKGLSWEKPMAIGFGAHWGDEEQPDYDGPLIHRFDDDWPAPVCPRESNYLRARNNQLEQKTAKLKNELVEAKLKILFLEAALAKRH